MIKSKPFLQAMQEELTLLLIMFNMQYRTIAYLHLQY